MLYLPSRNRLQRQKTVRLSTKWEVKFLQHLFVDSQPIPTVYLHSAVQAAVSSSFKDPTTALPLQP